MLAIYISLITFFILILIIFPPNIINDEENYISEENINNNRKNILIIPLNSLDGNSIINAYLEDMELPLFYTQEKLNRCYYLLNKYNSCFQLRKNKIEKCKDLYMNKIYEEDCGEIKDQIFGYNQPLIDFGDIFNEEEFDEKAYNNTLIEENIFQKKNNNENDKDNKELILDDNDGKDCIEYGLSEENQDLIVCTKYE